MPFGGPGEWLLILVLALIVFGPRRLPELGGSMGKAIREFRRATSDLTRDFSVGLDDVRGGAVKEGATATVPQAAEVFCPACATPNSSVNKFCGGCGKSMESATPQPPLADLICSSCGGANLSGNKFCSRCGNGLQPEPAPTIPSTETDRPT